MTENDPFFTHRTLLFSIAYRMLGSAMDAEDMVQETYVRWIQADQTTVQSPKAYLSATLTRLCIDHLRSARVQREQYIGPWLPEPVLGEQEPDVAGSVTLSESLSMAFLVLLESLTPVERAVFLLHDVFGYDFEEIAGYVGKSAANCRQIAHRAREHVRERRPRFAASPQEQGLLTNRFVSACATGDMPGLLNLLANEITLWSDGGGKVSAATKPIHGATTVARFLLGLMSKAPADLTVRVTSINGQPGIVLLIAEQLHSVLTLDSAEGHIQAIRIVRNPAKLRYLLTESQWHAEVGGVIPLLSDQEGT